MLFGPWKLSTPKLLKTDELTAHTFQTQGRRRTFTAPRGSRQPHAAAARAPQKDRPRPAEGLQAAARLVQLVRPTRDRRARPDRGPSSKYELELANFAAIPDHEQEPEEEAPLPEPEEPEPANLDPSDLFAYFFRV